MSQWDGTVGIGEGSFLRNLKVKKTTPNLVLMTIGEQRFILLRASKNLEEICFK